MRHISADPAHTPRPGRWLALSLCLPLLATTPLCLVSCGDKPGTPGFYQTAAAEGDVEAMYQLALCYEHGDGVPQDLGQAVEWYGKAAARKHQKAALRAAECFDQSIGTEANPTAATVYYRIAAEAGDTAAMAAMAARCREGKGTAQDAASAKEWYKKAADAGDTDCMYSLACYYLEGGADSPDAAKAIPLLLTAARQGRPDAAGVLGSCYMQGIGTAVDDKEAAAWLKQAAEAGLPDAMYRYASMCHDGRATEAPAKVFTYFLEAAEKGIAEAYKPLAICYLEGKGTDADPQKAAECFSKTAEDIPADTMCRLAGLYQGTQGDEQAFQWYLKAAEAGNTDAVFQVAGLYQSGKGVPQSDEQAFQWFCKAAEAGNTDAMARVAKCYEEGTGTKADAAAAIDWYLKAGLPIPDSSSNPGLQIFRKARQTFATGTVFKGTWSANGKQSGSLQLEIVSSKQKDGAVHFSGYLTDPGCKGASMDIDGVCRVDNATSALVCTLKPVGGTYDSAKPTAEFYAADGCEIRLEFTDKLEGYMTCPAWSPDKNTKYRVTIPLPSSK